MQLDFKNRGDGGIQRFLSKRCRCFIINLGVSWMGGKLEAVLTTQGRVNEALGQGKV